MNNNKSRELKVGAISLLAILLLIAGITIGKNFSVGSAQGVVLKFPNSAGLKSSEPVTINGVTRGTVKSVKNVGSEVIVVADLDNISDLKNDVSAMILIQELTGGKKIEIYPGVSSSSFQINDTISGTTPPDLSMLVSNLGDLSYDATLLVRRIDTIAVSAGEIINNEEFRNNLINTVDNAFIVSEDLKAFASNELPKVSRSLDKIDALTSQLKAALDRNEPKIDNIVSDLETTIKDVKSTLNNVDNLIESADNLIGDLKDISNEIKTGNGIVSKIIYDEEMSKKIEATIKSLDEFIGKVSDHGVNVNVRLGSRP